MTIGGAAEAQRVCTVPSLAGRAILDRTTESLLKEFSKEYAIEDLPEEKRFEHFSAFSVIRRHYSRAFSTSDVVIGGDGDGGIDAIAIIVNNNLVTDVDHLRELKEQNEYVEPTFIFVQSERSPNFSGQKIGSFGYGVQDFFAASPKLVRGSSLSNLAQISDIMINEYSAILKSPKCFMYYVTTGHWQDDPTLLAWQEKEVTSVQALSIFESVNMRCMGASELHAIYKKTKAPISRTFKFEKRIEIPATDGVIQALLGYVPFSEFKKLLVDESGAEILTSIFEDNVRDWQGYKPVNSKIRETLASSARSKFVLMNNGVTIITKGLNKVSDNFTLSEYQIVNGCQTSNVLFEQGNEIDDTVTIPLRLIHTEDDSINELITTATNSQTAIKPEQFASRRNFARGLEDFFTTFKEETRLYYERRDGQYDRGNAPKRRIIDISTAIRSYASIFQEVPHTVTKSYKSIRDQIGQTIFTEGHKYWAYYYASWSWHILEEFYHKKVIDKSYISARFHMLFAVHLMIDKGPKPRGNSKDIEQRSEAAAKTLWDPKKAEDLFKKAAALIDEITGGELDRDTVRTEAVTKAIIDRLRPHPPAGSGKLI